MLVITCLRLNRVDGDSLRFMSEGHSVTNFTKVIEELITRLKFHILRDCREYFDLRCSLRQT